MAERLTAAVRSWCPWNMLSPIGYAWWWRSEVDRMAPTQDLLERARCLAGLSRAELARRAGASRPTLALSQQRSG
jgi:hypothetical protein